MLKAFTFYVDGRYKVCRTVGGFKIERVLVPYYPCGTESAEKEERWRYRVTLTPTTNAEVEFMLAGDTDEGWSRCCVSAAEEVDDNGQPVWRYETSDEGVDCDGRSSSYFRGSSCGGSVSDYDNPYFPTLSDCSPIKAIEISQRDFNAEAAGY